MDGWGRGGQFSRFLHLCTFSIYTASVLRKKKSLRAALAAEPLYSSRAGGETFCSGNVAGAFPSISG